MPRILLLLTAPMTSPLAWHAVWLAQQLQAGGHTVQVFFYQDAAMIANRLNWRPDDEANLTRLWQSLQIPLPVCVSAALLRGVTDDANAQRHTLHTDNLAPDFHLVGLGELADLMLGADRVIQL